MITCTDLHSERRELPLAYPQGYPVRDIVAVVKWLDVERSQRYQPGDGNTWCNIFAADAAAGWGAVLPHWVNPDNSQGHAFHGRELTANGTWQWLHRDGVRYGWVMVDRDDVQDKVNAGRFAIAIWRAQLGQHGHIAVARPGPVRDDGPWIAQAGAVNFSAGVVVEGFGKVTPEWWMVSDDVA